jgi:hypothetical protein
MVHSVENIATTYLEFLDSPNTASPVPDEMRLEVPADAQIKIAS